jgi:hypothetical protein
MPLVPSPAISRGAVLELAFVATGASVNASSSLGAAFLEARIAMYNGTKSVSAGDDRTPGWYAYL